MPPKDSNIFAALAGASGDVGSPGARDAKKKARAAEHRRSNAALPSSTHPSLPPGTPFFTLAVEGPNTAVALDADGAEIVSLHFDDFSDLISDSFREYAAAAVAAVTATASRSGAADIVDLTLEDSDGDDDGEFYDALEPWEYEENLYSYENGDGDDGSGGLLDFDAEFAAALAEAAAGASEGHQHHVITDADLALALALQEEEEAAAEAAERARRAASTGAWGRPPPGPSFSSLLGSRMSEYGANTRKTAVDGEFPALGPPPSSATAGGSSGQQQRRVPLRVSMAASRSKGVRVVRTNAAASALREEEQGQRGAPAALPGLPGFVRADDQLARPDDFLNSVADEAVQARADALRWAKESAEREGACSGGSGGSGLDSAAVKRMMDSAAGARPPSGASASSHSLSESPAGLAVGAGAAEPEGDEAERGHYSRKSIRKLVLDMIAAGWEPLWGRGGGHLVYQRLIPPTGHKQLLVLPCTPSDRRSIEATHARLQRMDREAAEVRRRAEAAASGEG